MRPTVPRPPIGAAALAATIVVLAGCVGGDGAGDGDAATEQTQPPAPTVPEISGTPFCIAMIETSERLISDPPDDVTAFVIGQYESVLPDVPAEIRPDFEYVLADLRGDPLPELPEPPSSSVAPPTAPSLSAPPASAPESVPPTTPTSEAAPGTAPGESAPASGVDGSVPATTQPEPDEFFLPSVTPAERLSDYVDFTCRGNLNNPGPPATSPDVELPDPDDL